MSKGSSQNKQNDWRPDLDQLWLEPVSRNQSNSSAISRISRNRIEPKMVRRWDANRSVYFVTSPKRDNKGLAVVVTVLVVMAVYYGAISTPVHAQAATDEKATTAPSTESAPAQSAQPQKTVDTSQKQTAGGTSTRNSSSPDPVFQKQTTPPPEPTLAEKTPPPPSKTVATQTTTTQPPPEYLVEEDQPPPPSAHFVWVPGFWYWDGVQYFWMPGRWVESRPGYVFVRPHWVRSGFYWVFAPGGWAIASDSAIIYPYAFEFYARPWPRYYGHYGGYYHRGPYYRHPGPYRRNPGYYRPNTAPSNHREAVVAPRNVPRATTHAKHR
jgi:hypothetical protein